MLNRIRLECPDLESLCIKDQALTNESKLILYNLMISNWLLYALVFGIPYNACYNMFIGIEKIIGWALSHHFMHRSEDILKEPKLVISSER